MAKRDGSGGGGVAVVKEVGVDYIVWYDEMASAG